MMINNATACGTNKKIYVNCGICNKEEEVLIPTNKYGVCWNCYMIICANNLNKEESRKIKKSCNKN